MFTHSDEYTKTFVELTRLMEDGTRYYQVGEMAYPSVTSVISFVNKQKFADWRARVGNEVANAKTKHATTRGTKLHKLFEVYLDNGEYKNISEYEVPLYV